MFGKRNITKNVGGCDSRVRDLFFGMKLMSDAMQPLRTYTVFIDTMREMAGPFLEF